MMASFPLATFVQSRPTDVGWCSFSLHWTVAPTLVNRDLRDNVIAVFPLSGVWHINRAFVPHRLLDSDYMRLDRYTMAEDPGCCLPKHHCSTTTSIPSIITPPDSRVRVVDNLGRKTQLPRAISMQGPNDQLGFSFTVWCYWSHSFAKNGLWMAR